MSTETNPAISPLLRFLTLVEVIVLFLAGVVMFILPKIAVPFWPWELLPFNARFLGAVYSAACIAAIMQTFSGRWSPARLVTPMIFLFTFIIIVLSFIHIDVFDFSRWEVWVWFLLYIVLPINAAYHLWLYRNLPPSDPTPPSLAGRVILFVQMVILGLYGLILLVAPSFAKGIWSWTIDDFHAQVYSVTFITPAIGAYILMKGGSKNEWLTMGLTQFILGFFPILGVILVDMSVKRVVWSAAGTWIWFAMFAAITLVSLWMLGKSRR
jgi:hypothetical protein